MMGLLGGSPDEQARLNMLMGDLGNSIQQMPLDYEKLLRAGALRITQPGDGKGGFEVNSDPESYSIVSAYNDMSPNSITTQWPDKPESYAAALRDLRENSMGPLYDGKYRQMLWSAQRKGVSDFVLPGLLGR